MKWVRRIFVGRQQANELPIGSELMSLFTFEALQVIFANSFANTEPSG